MLTRVSPSDIQFRTRSKKEFSPLKDYDTYAEDNDSYLREGLPTRQKCSSFQDISSETIVHNTDAVRTMEF